MRKKGFNTAKRLNRITHKQFILEIKYKAITAKDKHMKTKNL